MMSFSYHYAFDAAKLLIDCLTQVDEVIDTAERGAKRGFQHHHASVVSSLYDMKETLVQAEHQLLCYFLYILQQEIDHASSPQVHEAYSQYPCYDLPSTVDFLKFVLVAESSAINVKGPDLNPNYYPRRNVTDSLLFRLNVALQLCLLRIDDSRSVVF